MPKEDNQVTIISDFDKNINIYRMCTESVIRLVQSILDRNHIKFHSVSGRVKDREKLSEKIIRKQNKYKSIADITDIIGVRIITYFEDEIDKIAALLKNEFQIDEANSIDKRVTENDRFGYRSLHTVVSFKDERVKLTEYSPFKSIKIEIQIRSILQHSWAEIEHDLGYKGEFEIPDVAKRTFYRLSAMLELADIEFVRLKEIIENYENSITRSIEEKKVEISIDKASLLAYVHSSDTIKSQIEPIGTVYNFSDKFNVHKDIETSSLIERLKKLEVNSINHLDMLLNKYVEESLNYLKEDYDGHKISALNAAAPIYNLVNYLEKKNGG